MPSAFEAINDLSRHTTALFLDFDGTLAPIVGRPDDVRVAPRVIAHLKELQATLDGAVAIVSGRQIASLDHFLHPEIFPASGAHGFELRNGGEIRRLEAKNDVLAQVTSRLKDMVASHAGLLLERKQASVALHYRSRPDLLELCREHVAELVDGHPDLVVLMGKMVIEIKGHAGNKGRAIEDFLRIPPFVDRMPVFIGDDVTDEAGFDVVNKVGGLSVKVGDGATLARYELPDTDSVAAWLEQLVEHFNRSANLGEAEP